MKIVGVNRCINRISDHTGIKKVCVKHTLHACSEMNNAPVLHVNVDGFFFIGIHIDVNSRKFGDLC